MAFANFFDRSATAASQVLSDFNVESYKATLSANMIGLYFDEAAAVSPEGRATLDMCVRILARLYPAIVIAGAGSKAEAFGKELTTLAVAINDRIDLSTDIARSTVAIVVGETDLAGSMTKLFVGSDGWHARLSRSAPVGSGPTANPFGAGAAGCFAAANIFRFVFASQLVCGDLDDRIDVSLFDYRLNLAVGEMLMLCAYFFFGMTAAFALPIWLAIILTVIGGGILGGVIERILIRPMLGESPISVFMVTVGLSSVLIGFVEFVWGSDPATLPNFLPSKPIFIGSAYISPKIAVSFVVATVLIAAFLVVFRTWRGGVALRATATDQGAAFSCGINVPAVFSVSWIVAGMAAAGSGILIGSIGGISPTMGVFGLSVLVAVIVGGLDSIAGALVAGLAIGVVEALVGTYMGGEFKLLVTFSILVVALMIRPYGLFGTVEIERL